MEFFDVLDIEGNKTGLTLPRGSTLESHQYYMGAHCYIHNSNGEFLLQQRGLDKEFLPGGWDIHMGHVMAGESSEEAILREIHEEIGLGFDSAVHLERFVWSSYQHMIDVFYIQSDLKLDEVCIDGKEVIAVKYVDCDEMLKLVEGMTYRPEAYRRSIGQYVKSLRRKIR